MSPYRQIYKRAFDLFFSSLLAIVLFPVWFFVLLLLFIFYGGKQVFFTQKRLGLSGNEFVLWKFRTLRSTPKMPIGHHESEITGIGKWLRKSGLDELPQLLNVFRGEMSLVGPRPLPVEYKAVIEKKYDFRLKVKPGITGPAQVKGRNRLTWEERFAQDEWYCQNISLLTDLNIVFLTIFALFKAEGDVPSEKLNVG